MSSIFGKKLRKSPSAPNHADSSNSPEPQSPSPKSMPRSSSIPQQQYQQENNNGNVKPKLTFHCQQAQGSPTGIISGFTNVKELYAKIAACYDMPSSDVSLSYTL